MTAGGGLAVVRTCETAGRGLPPSSDVAVVPARCTMDPIVGVDAGHRFGPSA